MDGEAPNKRKTSEGVSSGKPAAVAKKRASATSKLATTKSTGDPNQKQRTSQASERKSEAGASSNKRNSDKNADDPEVAGNQEAKRVSDKGSDWESGKEDITVFDIKKQRGTTEEDGYSEQSQSLSIDQGEIDFMNESEGEDTYVIDSDSREQYTDTLADEEMDDEKELDRIEKSRSVVLRDLWHSISKEIKRTFDNPTRIFKLRGYHSEPDLSIPFEEKFEVKFQPPRKGQEKLVGKSVSYEDIVSFSTKEHPDLVRGVLSELRLKNYAVDDKMENAWREIYELEKKRYSFFDELFAMGYVVDSLEVLSTPPKGEDGRPVTTGEYFIEADERHYRKKVDYGRVVFKTKHVYTGNFQDWYFEGPGRYCWQDGTIYQGEFHQGLMHGPGSIHWPDGCIYEGHFINGIRAGWGVYSSADGHTYAGEWFEGLPHGHGKMWYDPEDDDNDYYEGQWEKGLPQGIGTRQYATGDRYIGNWQKGLRHGYGIMIWLLERQVYKGEWFEGVPNGFGKHMWYLERSPTNSFPSRHVYQGDWVMGRREGVGKMVYPCGSIYEGKWKNGQRHGKGMYINPAGDILVGLFRAGSLVGGSQVPLHAPTYECDYTGLADWLTARFSLNLSDKSDEMPLLEITKKYLPFLRMMYHRAGEFSQKYGNHGLYPAYMKKGPVHSRHDNHATHQNPPKQGHNPHHHDTGYTPRFREYNRLNEPEHMKGKFEKPEALDGINPVTRFGLWLVIRDCESLLDEVTMAYYDKLWCETPPISFQTRHNPFEPVYLWQFLEALIATAVAFYVDIPRKRLMESEKESMNPEDVAVSDTTLNAGISYEEHKRQLIARRHRARAGRLSNTLQQQQEADQQLPLKIKSSQRKRRESNHRTPHDVSPHDDHKDRGKSMKPKKTMQVDNPSMEMKTNKTKSSFTTTREQSVDQMRDDLTSVKTRDLRKSKLMRKSRGKSIVANTGGSPLLSGSPLAAGGDNSSVIEGNTEEDLLLWHYSEEGGESGSEMGEEEAEEGDPDNTAPPTSIAECFERLITEQLIPCLKRNAGERLPVVPQPLPALVDMYESFKGIKDRDILKGTEFFRSSLPHLLFPNPKDAIWWHRCPEPLSLNADLNELFDTFRQKFPEAEEIDLTEDNFEEKLESEYLGVQAQNSETTLKLLQICKENPKSEECGSKIEHESKEIAHPVPVPQTEIPVSENLENEELGLVSDFIKEDQPFGEEELVSEPLLWADDYKCVPVPRNYQHFENISAQDVIDVLNDLYPNLCKGQHEKDLHFELIFCDWLWCTSLLAKKSTEREFRNAWKYQPDSTRPITNPQSLGVFAHYCKRIKDNPYLSPNPPPDFVPHKRKDEFGSDGKKGVKFSK